MNYIIVILLFVERYFPQGVLLQRNIFQSLQQMCSAATQELRELQYKEIDIIANIYNVKKSNNLPMNPGLAEAN